MYLAPNVSDVALEPLIDPELPFAAGQVRQVLRDRSLSHRDHAVMVGIDVVSGAGQRAEQNANASREDAS